MTQMLNVNDAMIPRERTRDVTPRAGSGTANLNDADTVMDRRSILELLNTALAAELLSLTRCKKHYYLADGTSEALRQEFLEQAIEESMHTDRLVERILELGGLPDFSSETLRDLNTKPEAPPPGVQDLIREDLDAQRLSIETYREMIRCIGTTDSRTCSVLEDMVRRDQHFIERLARHLGDF